MPTALTSVAVALRYLHCLLVIPGCHCEACQSNATELFLLFFTPPHFHHARDERMCSSRGGHAALMFRNGP